jgi:hypothetical protein
MDGVAKAAGRIGYSETMGQMGEHIGAAAPGFTERALLVPAVVVLCEHAPDAFEGLAERRYLTEGVVRVE